MNKIASALAFVIGTMAIFAGAQVWIAEDPGYFVIDWLPLYNYTLGILTVFITALLIWTNNKFAWPAVLDRSGALLPADFFGFRARTLHGFIAPALFFWSLWMWARPSITSLHSEIIFCPGCGMKNP